MDYYRSYRPSPALSPYIDCVWEENFFDQPQHSRRPHLIVPDNTIELIISEHPVERRQLQDNATVRFHSHLAGLKTRPQEIRLSRSCLLSIRFRAHGLYRFTGVDARELIDQTLSPADVFGRSFALLEEQLLEARSMPERLALIDNYFLRKLDHHSSRQDPLFETLMQQLETGKGNISITDLAAHSGFSIKTVERKFLQNLGLSPKKYSRLVRLFHALRIPDPASGQTLTETAYQHGYYDQMHFVREVKHFTGMVPGAYFQQDRGIQQAIFSRSAAIL